MTVNNSDLEKTAALTILKVADSYFDTHKPSHHIAEDVNGNVVSSGDPNAVGLCGIGAVAKARFHYEAGMRINESIVCEAENLAINACHKAASNMMGYGRSISAFFDTMPNRGKIKEFFDLASNSIRAEL